MDFREVTAALQGAALESHSIDLGVGRVVLLTSPRHAAGQKPRSVVFENLITLKWTGDSTPAAGLVLSVVGLERLGAGEPWRLYTCTDKGAEMELSCSELSCDGDEVTGVGRSYRH